MNALIIASFLGYDLHGENVHIDSFSSLSELIDHSIVFAKEYKEEYVVLLNKRKCILAIVPPQYDEKIECSYIISNNPRLDYIKVLSSFFSPRIGNGKIHPSAILEKGARIGKNVTIGANCFLSSNTIIGDNTILHPNVVLDNDVVIGSNCEIKSGVVMGQDGFGFERDEQGNAFHFPHFGRVVIMDNVYVGANTCIDRGTLGDTIIEDGAKIDNLVHIAHNCHIGKSSFVIAGAVLGGGTQVGNCCWLAPNISIKEKTKINDRSLIGLGAVVLKEVEKGAIMVGNPAKKLEKK